MEQTYLPGTVRERIQDLVKERSVTQAELADAIGLSASALSRFMSKATDKLGDEYILKIADYFDVSADFILGQTDFPERRNYDIGELGLSYKAAMALYTRSVDTDVVNRILESPQFPAITRMIARYFDDTFAEGFAARNAILGAVKQLAGSNEVVSQLVDAQKIQPVTADLDMIRDAIMEMLRTIKQGIQTQTPTTELATKHLTDAMMQSMTKGESSVPTMPSMDAEQIAYMSAAFTGASPEFGKDLFDLMSNFVTGFKDIAQKQGLMPDESSDE